MCWVISHTIIYREAQWVYVPFITWYYSLEETAITGNALPGSDLRWCSGRQLWGLCGGLRHVTISPMGSSPPPWLSPSRPPQLGHLSNRSYAGNVIFLWLVVGQWEQAGNSGSLHFESVRRRNDSFRVTHTLSHVPGIVPARYSLTTLPLLTMYPKSVPFIWDVLSSSPLHQPHTRSQTTYVI